VHERGSHAASGSVELDGGANPEGTVVVVVGAVVVVVACVFVE
jgi:phage tail sheath gpL-like